MDQLVEASSRQLDLGLTWHNSFVELGPSSYTPVDAKLRDYSAVQDLLARVQAPFNEHPGHDEKAGFPSDRASHIEISCSS